LVSRATSREIGHHHQPANFEADHSELSPGILAANRKNFGRSPTGTQIVSLEKMFSEEWKERRRYALLHAAAIVFTSNDVQSDIEAVDIAIKLAC